MKLNLRAVLLSIALCTLGSSAIPTKHGLFEKRDDYGISYEEPHKDYFTPITHLPFTEKPVTRHYELELTQEKISPDGFEKIGFVVNGQYPGPILLVNKGDRMVIKVVNKLGAKSTLHWHGMRQYQTPWFDGSANGVTQCPIPDEETFVYDFSTEYQSGTYWYHGHFRGQYINGLRGVFVIHDPEDPYLNAYDDEYVLTLSEIYHALAEDLVRQRLAPGYKGFNPVADSGVISGRGRYKCSAAPKGSKCDPDAPLAEYKVQKGKRYRLRLINSSANSLFKFSIDNHQMKVIEADGVYTKELLVNKLPINIGQRYSVLIEANQPVDNYQIRATIAKECLHINNATINANSAIDFKVVGVLKYEGAGDKEPTSVEFPDQPPTCSDLPPNSLVPFFPEPKLGPADKTFYMNVTFQLTPQQVVLAFINDNSFVPDYYNPTLQKVIEGVDPKTLPPNQNAFIFDKPDESIELRIFNSNLAEHPFHMHGHNFSILGVGTGPKIIESQLNLVNPTIRDIATAPPYGWLVLRFPANNPGVWSFHCHIEWHVEVGFSAQLVELPGQVTEFKLPEVVKNLCPKS